MKNMTFKKITSQRLFLPIFCLALVLLVNIITTPNFFAIEIRNGVLYGYLIDIINRASELVILAVGMTLVVSSSAGTDISVGAIMAVSAAVCCNILTGGERAATAYANPLLLGFLAALLVGAAIGCFNGFLVAKLNIQPMVATLIMFTAGRGIAQLITDGQITYVRVDSYRTLGASLPGFPVPTPFIVAVIVVALTSLLLKKTALGMYIQSVGINKRASQLVGIKSVMIIFLTYAYLGLCSGPFRTDRFKPYLFRRCKQYRSEYGAGCDPGSSDRRKLSRRRKILSGRFSHRCIYDPGTDDHPLRDACLIGSGSGI